MHTWQQCSVTISEDILTTKYSFNLREISPLNINNKLDNNTNILAGEKRAAHAPIGPHSHQVGTLLKQHMQHSVAWNQRGQGETVVTFGPNLVVLAWTGDELSHRPAQNGVNFDFEVKFDFEGQGQSLPKTKEILTKVFYIYGPNFVILAERGDELSRGQARDWRTDGHTHRQTDAGNDNTRRPKLASGKNQRSLLTTHPAMLVIIGVPNMEIVYPKL